MGISATKLPEVTELSEHAKFIVADEEPSLASLDTTSNGMLPILVGLGVQVEGQENQISNSIRILKIFANFTLSDGYDLYLVFSTGTEIICNLPTVSSFYNETTGKSRVFTIKLISNVGSVTIIPVSTEYIDGEESITISNPNEFISIVPGDSYYWSIVNKDLTIATSIK